MNYKYKKIYETKVGNKILKIVQSKSFYVVQHCKNSYKDFSRKATRYKSVDINEIIEYCRNKFNLNINRDDLLIKGNKSFSG